VSSVGASIRGRPGGSVENSASGDQSDQSEHSSCALRMIELLHRNVRRFQGGLVFKVHILCVVKAQRLCVSSVGASILGRPGESVENAASGDHFNQSEHSSCALRRIRSQFENTCFTEMCSGSEAGSCLRLIDFVYHSTLGLRVINPRQGGRERREVRVGGPV